MGFSDLWQGRTERRPYLVALIVSSAAIAVLPFVARMIALAYAPGQDPAFAVMRMLLFPAVLLIGFLIAGGVIVYFARRRMRELGLSGVWLMLFPLAPLLMLLLTYGVASLAASIRPPPLTSPVTVPFWILCAFGLLLAAIPGERPIEESASGILRFAHRATDCEGRLGRAGFALRLVSALGLAFAVTVFRSLLRIWAQQSGLSMPIFTSVLTSASVLFAILLTMFVTASTIRRLHDLNLRGWWIVLFPFGVFSLGSVYILIQPAMNLQFVGVALLNPFFLLTIVQGLGCPVLLIVLLLKRGSDLDNRYGAPINAPGREP